MSGERAQERELQRHIVNSGLKQNYIAEKAGIPEKTFSYILKGKRKCSVDEYSKICIALGVPFEEFLQFKPTG